MDGSNSLDDALNRIDDKTDSRIILAKAKQQASKRNFDDVFIVDIDSHKDWKLAESKFKKRSEL